VATATIADPLSRPVTGPVGRGPDRPGWRTVVGFLHYSLVDRRPRLAIYVRPNGALGRCYMALIEPFRRGVIYPALLAAGARAATRLGATER